MSKILVTYFSASGVTARVAAQIAAAVGADVYEIRPAQPYTAADLDWTHQNSRSSVEMRNAACRPALAGTLPDMAQYDTVFVGFPIWWGVQPRVVDTFLESAGLAGKRLIPFATSGGSGMAQAQSYLQQVHPGLLWQQGRLVNRGAAAWAAAALRG